MRNVLFVGALLLSLPAVLSAQISAVTTHQDASCSYNQDGSITIDSIEGCFAPLEISINNQVFPINHLKNDAYNALQHGAGINEDRAYSVWGGNTSIGDVYLATGSFTSSVAFDTFNLTASGSLDMFAVCYDANTNNVLWAISGGTTGNTFTAGYAITGAGDKAYVTGYFTGACQIGNFNIVSTGGYQAFIAKIDIPSGSVDTVVQYGGINIQEGFNINYANGRIYLAGNFQSSITFGATTHNATGSLDGFVACIDTNLSTIYWSAAAGGSNTVIMNDLVPVSNGNTVEKVFVVATYNSATTVGTTNLPSIGGNDFFIAAVDTTGTWLWAINGGSTGADFCTTIDANSAGDRLYVGGSWNGTMNFAGNNYSTVSADDGFIAYIDTAGVVDSLYQFSGGGVETIKDLQSVDDDFLLFTATFNTSVTYADSTYSTNGGVDAFVGKIGKSFHEIWGKNFGGALGDQFASVRTGTNDRYHLGGFFQGNASVYQSGLVSAGNLDVIVTNDLMFGMADTSITITGLQAGSYPIQYTDSNGNIILDSVILGPDAITATGIVTNTSSGSANDGSIDLTVTGGVPGYTYLWNNGAITQDIDSLIAGIYCVTITDTTGCVDSSYCFTVDSAASGGPLSIMVMVQNLTCFNDSTGAINVTVTGGTPPYSFLWSNGATTEDLVNINAGTYILTLTDNAGSLIDTFIVSQPAAIAITSTLTPPSSGSASDGAIDITVAGGTPGYSFNWSTGDITEDLNNLTIGLYTVTVTDSAGCLGVEQFILDTVPALGLISTASSVTCINTNNGSIDVTVVGGVPPFAFIWTNGATTEDLTGLAAGAYGVTVTDALNQTASIFDTVGSNPIFPSPIVGPITGGNSVQAWTSYNYSVPSSNGSSFNWSAFGGSILNSASNAAIVQWNAGPNGTLYVQETDLNGCTAEDSLSINILFVGIDEEHAYAIAVFPNPTSDFLRFELPSTLSIPVITMTDLQGRIVAKKSPSNHAFSIDLTSVPAGTYVLELTYSDLGLTLNHKVIKQ